MRFHLSQVDSQDEYDVTLDLLDDNKFNVAKIYCKINFIWSYHLLYQDLITKTEKKINNLNHTIQKCNKILGTLNGN